MAKKKDFTNPMGFFFSQESIEQAEKPQEAIEEQKPAPKRTARKSKPANDPPRREKKTQRVQILLQPTLFNELRQRAYEEDMSVNEAISRAIKAYLKERK